LANGHLWHWQRVAIHSGTRLLAEQRKHMNPGELAWPSEPSPELRQPPRQAQAGWAIDVSEVGGAHVVLRQGTTTVLLSSISRKPITQIGSIRLAANDRRTFPVAGQGVAPRAASELANRALGWRRPTRSSHSWFESQRYKAAGRLRACAGWLPGTRRSRVRRGSQGIQNLRTSMRCFCRA
jgi:hypothetical protein